MPRQRREGVKVYAKPAMAKASVSASVAVQMQTHMLLHWSDIAIEQERLAWAARRKLELQVAEAKATGKGLELGREFQPSLIAIAAASHALDALYGELRDLALPPELAAKWKANPRLGPSRPRKLHETLKHGFRISADQWETRLDRLFELRDGAVHPKSLSQNSEPHPPFDVNTAIEYVVYRSERATEAVDLLLEILEICVERPKPALERWANDLRPSIERLSADRSRGSP